MTSLRWSPLATPTHRWAAWGVHEAWRACARTLGRVRLRAGVGRESGAVGELFEQIKQRNAQAHMRAQELFQAGCGVHHPLLPKKGEACQTHNSAPVYTVPQELFERDVECIIRFFSKKLGYVPELDEELEVIRPCFQVGGLCHERPSTSPCIIVLAVDPGRLRTRCCCGP